MKKSVLKISLIVMMASVLSLIIFISLLLEPAIRINGYAELDKNKLAAIYDTITVMYPDGKSPLKEGQREGGSEFVSISELSEYTKNAFIAIEDKRYYSHSGVDYVRILGAAKNNILSGSFKEGASTITQQLVKNTHLKNDKTIKRKIQEVRISRELERSYDKNEILEMYLNILYFGNNSYGISAAAEGFFGKNANELSLAESATLAGIINNPSRYNPIINPENAVKRRNTVLSRMLEQKMITDDEYNKAVNEPLFLRKRSNEALFDQYSQACINEAAELLKCDTVELYGKDITIISYCNKNLQDYALELIAENEVKNGEISIIVSRNENGEVIANVSDSLSDINTAKRQPGSTIKPFLCYAPVLDNGVVFTCTPILDEKACFNGWCPRNFNDKYYGWTSVEESLVRSLNIPAVKLLEIGGIERAKKLAKAFGFDFSTDDNSLAIALGGMTEGVTLQQLNDAYRCLANGGNYAKGRYVQSILTKDGKVIYRNDYNNKIAAISKETAYLITDCLEKCARYGTAGLIKYAGENIAAKTGTVGNKNGNTDAYCVAYTPLYTVSVRVSAKNGLLENKISGGNLPTILARKIFNFLSDETTFSVPSGIISADIDILKLENEHKVQLADHDTPLLNRRNVLFNKKYAPKKYPKTGLSFNETDSILDDFNNFEIVDGFFDKSIEVA